MASYVIIAVLFCRFFLKKANQPTFFALWLVVFLRLALPFTWENPFYHPNSPINEVNQSNSKEYSDFLLQFPLVPDGNNFTPQDTNAEIISPSPRNESEETSNNLDLFSLALTLWIGGMVAMTLVFVVSTLKIQSKIRYASKLEGNIYLVDHTKTAFVWGLLQPKIYLPSTLNEEDKSYILPHEQEHIKRFDHLTRIFAYILLSIHWFNPFVWIAYHVAGTDMELSVDEKVLRNNTHNDSQQKYAETLLRHATGNKLLSPLAFGERGVKERIVNIMKIKKRSRFLLGLVTVLTLGTLVACSSEPSDNQVKDNLSPAIISVNDPDKLYSNFGLSLELPALMIQVESGYHYYMGKMPADEILIDYYFGFETRPDIPKEEAMAEWEIMIEDRTEWEQLKVNSGDFSSFTTDNGEVFDFAYAITEDHVYFGNGVDASVEPPFRQLYLMAMFLLENEQIFYHCTLDVQPELGNSDENVQIQYNFLLEQVGIMQDIAKTFVVEEEGLTSSAVPIEFIEIDPEALEEQEIILQEQGLSQYGRYVTYRKDENKIYTCIIQLELQEVRFSYVVIADDRIMDSKHLTLPYTLENGQIIISEPDFFIGNVTDEGISFISGDFIDEFDLESFLYKPSEGDVFMYRDEFEMLF